MCMGSRALHANWGLACTCLYSLSLSPTWFQLGEACIGAHTMQMQSKANMPPNLTGILLLEAQKRLQHDSTRGISRGAHSFFFLLMSPFFRVITPSFLKKTIFPREYIQNFPTILFYISLHFFSFSLP